MKEPSIREDSKADALGVLDKLDDPKLHAAQWYGAFKCARDICYINIAVQCEKQLTDRNCL